MSTKKRTKKTFQTFSASETQKLAAKLLAGFIEKAPESQALVLALQGDLGSGKTTFVQGLAMRLGIKKRITSPTFVLMKKFAIKHCTRFVRSQESGKDRFFTKLYHIDCYRINKPEDVLALGFKEIVSNPQNIIAIEWPEKIKSILPKNALRICFRVNGVDKRELKWYNKSV